MTNRHLVKLAVLPKTGSLTHIVADIEILDNCLLILTACGKVFEPELLFDIHHNQISCERCLSVSKKYHHKVGYIRHDMPDETLADDNGSLPF